MAQSEGCGGSMGGICWLRGSTQDCKSAVPGSNPSSTHLSSLQGHVSSLLGKVSIHGVGLITVGWPLMGGRGKNTKYQNNNITLNLF